MRPDGLMIGSVRESPFGAYNSAVRGTIESVDVPTWLRENLPSFDQILWAVVHEQSALASQVLSDEDTHRSVRLLFNLAVNDFLDLVTDLKRGAGRPAMRAARALIEHAINMHTVVDSIGNARRYLDHLDQGPAIALDLRVGEDRLHGDARRAYVRALKKAGTGAHARFERAVQQHGTRFRRGWIEANLADRSSTYNLDHVYRYYKLASLVTHGSAGGSLGSIRDRTDGPSTFRTGPALELAPLAMWAGIAGYREVLSGLAKVRTDINFDAYSGALDRLDATWAVYFLAMRTVDEALWPQHPVRAPSTILAFTKTKKRRWYLHLPISEVLLQAEDPVLTDKTEAHIANMINDIVNHGAFVFREDQRWTSVSVPHVAVTPDGTGKWIPSTAIMEVPPEHWEPTEFRP